MPDETVKLNGVPYPCVGYTIGEHERELTFTYGPDGDFDWRHGIGPGYIYSDGWDATRRELRLSGTLRTQYIAGLTETHGAFLEYEKPQSDTGVTIEATAEGGGSGAEITIAIDCGTAANRVLFAMVAVDTLAAGDYDDHTAEFPEYNGVEMSLERDVTGTPGYLFFELVNPSSGSNNFVMPAIAGKDVAVTLLALSGVYQTESHGNINATSGSSGSPSANANPAYKLAVSFLAYTGTGPDLPTVTPAVATPQQEIVQNGASGVGCALMTLVPDALTETMAATLSPSTAWKQIAFGVLAATDDTYISVGNGEQIHKLSYDGTATVLGTITLEGTHEEPNANFGGRGVVAGGQWYLPAGAGAEVQRLATVTGDGTADTWSDAGFYALEMCEFQNQAFPEIAATYFFDLSPGSTLTDLIRARLATVPTPLDDALATALDGANFVEAGVVGEETSVLVSVAQNGGYLGLGKWEGFFEVDSEDVMRPVFGTRSKIAAQVGATGNDTDSGRYVTPFGDGWFYPQLGTLWFSEIARDAYGVDPSSLDLIPDIQNTGLTTLKHRRPYSPVVVGKYIYYCLGTTTAGAWMMLRPRQEGDPAGPPFVTHMLYDRDLWKGGFTSQAQHLWVKEATAVPADRGVTTLHLGLDGSPDTATRRGNTSDVMTIAFVPIRPFPNRDVQLRSWDIETANGFAATTSLQAQMYVDEDDSANNIGSAITADGVTTLVPTVGTNDEGQRWIPVLQMTTNGSYAPLTEDPWVLSMRLVFRTPQIIRIAIPLDEELLRAKAGDIDGVIREVQRLLSRGPITVDPVEYSPGISLHGTPYEGEVVGANVENQYVYKDGRNELMRVLAVRVRRWVQD